MKRFFIVIIFFSLVFSINAFAKKSEKPSDRAIEHNNKGVAALYNEGDIDKAIFEFKTATEMEPHYVEAWSNLGLAYKHKGQFDNAVNALRKAIDLDKKFASPHNHLGVVYHAMGKYEDAIKEFDLAIKCNSKFADAHYNKGLVYQEQYDRGGHDTETLKKAADSFKKSTDINPDHPYAHLKLANAYQTLGQYEQAIIRYRLALEINPNLNDAWNNLAALYTKTGQTLKAQQALNHALASDSDSAQAHINMGLNYLSDGNINMAIQEFNTVIKNEPTNELAYFNVGYAYYKLALIQRQSGKETQAKSAFEESNRAYESALKLYPAYPEAAFNIGYNYHLMKDLNNAVVWYQKAVAINTNFAQAHYGLGQVYQALTKNADAAKEYCQVIKLNPSEFANEMGTIKETVKSLGGCP